jgi:hypothetical protein
MGNGKSGYKYGGGGHCYGSRQGALRQMKAMYANGYTGKSEGPVDSEITPDAKSISS